MENEGAISVVAHEFSHAPGVSYCPSCSIVREYLSRDESKCARYGTWLSYQVNRLRFGPNLYQDHCCHCLTKFDLKETFGPIASRACFLFDIEACDQCKIRNQDWVWIGFKTIGSEVAWKRLNLETASFYPSVLSAPKSLFELSELCGLEFPKHISKIPSWVCEFTNLQTLNLRSCALLESLPIKKLLEITSLQSLECGGCSQLWTPPQEICNQGGETTVNFLRHVQTNGVFSTQITMFLIGDGEAGKTSVIMALKSTNNRADYIRADHRTIGIDVSSWNPESSDIEFLIYDLAGQAVYSKTHQLFLLRRAVYLFVWRAGDLTKLDLRKTIRHWLQALQCRMPGAYLLLVVTHIDLVDKETLNLQCEEVKNEVGDFLRSLSGITKQGIPILRIWTDGESARVDCLSGEGIDKLRNLVIAFSNSMPWFKEGLPESWVRLRSELDSYRDLQATKHVSYFSWDEYAEVAKSCDVPSEMIGSVTTFLHDTGIVRYFGGGAASKSSQISAAFRSTVYISIVWMMDVMKGLIRHERQALLDHFWSTGNKQMLTVMNKLIACGRLHEELIPFLWPSQPESEQFWTFVRSKGNRESKLWKDTIVKNKEEGRLAMALLVGFDLAHEFEGQFIVPSVLPPLQIPCMPTVDIAACPHRVTYTYKELPPGAFETVLVRVAKQGISLVNFTTFFAMFSSGNDILQVFLLKTNFSELAVETLVLRSSSRELYKIAEQQIINMESFFSGLVRLKRDKRTNVVRSLFNFDLKSLLSASREEKLQLNILSDVILCPACVDKAGLEEAFCFERTQCLLIWKQFVKNCVQDLFLPDSPTLNCPKCQHRLLLLDMLTTYKIPDLRPCPICLKAQLLKSNTSRKLTCFKVISNCFCRSSSEVLTTIPENVGYIQDFSAGEVRLHFESKETQFVTCFQCISQGRVGQVSVDDIVPPEVLVSGLAILGENMQGIIRNFLCHLEEAAEVRFWELSGHERKKFKVSVVSKSLFWFIFLSDAYLVTKEFVSDIRLALAGCKLIIPILLPETGLRNSRGMSLGWSGPSCEENWLNPLEDLEIRGELANSFEEWKVLKFFKPQTFPLAEVGKAEKESSSFLSSISSLIKTRFERPGKQDFFSDFSILGIKLSFFDHFIEQNGGRSIFEGLTTFEVMERFVKPATRQSKLSYCDFLRSEGHDKFIGNSEWFYSHAWKFLFLNVVDSAKRYFPQGSDPILWFDVFSVSQHQADSRPYEWWNLVFLNAIGTIGKVLMSMQPFEDQRTQTPQWTTLTRVWCVFEVYACEATMSFFDVTMTEEASHRFLEAIKNRDKGLLESLFEIDCQRSVASVPEDRERVFEAILRTVGFPLLNSTVLRVMEKWIYKEFFVLIRSAHSSDLSEYFYSMRLICEKCGRRRLLQLGLGHPDTLKSKSVLASILNAEENFEYAQHLINASLEFRDVFALENQVHDIAEEFFKSKEVYESSGGKSKHIRGVEDAVTDSDHTTSPNKTTENKAFLA